MAMHNPAPRFRSASLGGLHFHQVIRRDEPEHPDESGSNLVATSIFRMRNSYRDMEKYATGLLWLAKAVETHLPGFLLRIYFDASVCPERLEWRNKREETRGGEPEFAIKDGIRVYHNAWKQLSAMPHVRLVYFQADEFFSETLQEHADLFGTIVRFVPLFDTTGVLPSWCGGPPDGRVVFLTDADFQDLTTEHCFLHLCSWYTTYIGQQLDKCTAAGVPFAETVAGDPDFLSMASFTTAGSTSLRHKPIGGLPSIIANCMCTSLRYPLSWFTDWYEDSASGRAFLLGRYCVALHAPANQNNSYGRRKIATQDSLFPFGCDEQLLANVVKPRAMCLPKPSTWLYLVMPNVDVLVRKCVEFVRSSVALDATLATDSYVLNALKYTAETAGARAVAASLDTCLREAAAAHRRPELPHELNPLPLDTWHKMWPKAAERQVGVYQTFRTNFVAVDKDVAAPFVSAYHEMVRAFVEAVAAGRVLVDEDDYELLLQNLTHFGRMSGEAYSVVTYQVGGGAAFAKPVPHALDTSLIQYLREVRNCPVGRPVGGALQRPVGAHEDITWGPPMVHSTNPRLGQAYGRYKGLPADSDTAAASGVVSAPSGSLLTIPHMDSRATSATAASMMYTAPVPAPILPAPPAAPVIANDSPWVATLSRSRGVYYWHNRITNATSWEQPIGAPDAPSVVGSKRLRSEFDGAAE